MSSVQWSSGLMLGAITIFASGDKTAIKNGDLGRSSGDLGRGKGDRRSSTSTPQRADGKETLEEHGGFNLRHSALLRTADVPK